MSPTLTSLNLLKLTCLPPDKVELWTVCLLLTLPLFSSQANSSPEFSADQGIVGSISAEGEESQQGGRERNGKYSAAHFLDEQAQMERLPEAPTKSESTAGGGRFVSWWIQPVFTHWCLHLLPFAFHFWLDMEKLFFWLHTLRSS